MWCNSTDDAPSVPAQRPFSPQEGDRCVVWPLTYSRQRSRQASFEGVQLGCLLLREDGRSRFEHGLARRRSSSHVRHEARPTEKLTQTDGALRGVDAPTYTLFDAVGLVGVRGGRLPRREVAAAEVTGPPLTRLMVGYLGS